MKISVLCASRNNMPNLRTILGALDMLASGNHEIKYVVSADIDDDKTTGYVRVWSVSEIGNIEMVMTHRDCLGSKWNRAAVAFPADVYALVTDRALCITPYWDNVIADAYSKDDTRITWWSTSAGPVIPIVPRKWMEAAGQIYTDYFPFWFDDTWLQELSAMVHGMPMYGVEAACFIAKKNPVTKRMRDLRFWMDFFIAKRPERMEHAERIREKLGLPDPDMKPVNDWFESNEALWAKDWKKWQDAMQDNSEPEESYRLAKKSAEEFMNVKAN